MALYLRDSYTHNFQLTGNFAQVLVFINLKTCAFLILSENLAFMRMHIFRMKSMESFINEVPGEQRNQMWGEHTWLLSDIHFGNVDSQIFSPFCKLIPHGLELLAGWTPWSKAADRQTFNPITQSQPEETQRHWGSFVFHGIYLTTIL